MQRVAVIGAGAAGLCSARYLSAKPDLFEPVVFEKADCIGGTWVFTEGTGTDRHGLPIQSTMYKNLKTNLPKEIMAFPDLPFDHQLPSYVTAECVLQYLEQYAAKFDLLKYIKFHSIVESVKPITIGDKTRWEVTVRDLDSKETSPQTSSIFDAVMVCNGQFSVPKIPQLLGQETFKGKIIHSQCYRQPEEFKDSIVVCVGIGPSAQDIGLHLHKHAKKVYLSHWNDFLPSEFPINIMQVPPIDSLHGNTVKFTDGQVHEVDIIILCTGYEYSFPFLTEDCGITINDKVVSPLYKHIIHTEYPSLSFIGIAYDILPFPMYPSQVSLAIAVLGGSFKLPSNEEMEADIRMDLQKRLDMGWPHRYAHVMGDMFMFEYDKEVSQLACMSPMNPVFKSIRDEISTQKYNNVWHYKELNYEILDERNWRYVEK